MRHIVALIIKSVMIFAILWVMLNVVYNYPMTGIIGLTLLTAILAYLVGDLAILPLANNLIASIADVGLSTLTIWLLGPFFLGVGIPFYIAFFTGLVIGGGEWFFHKYMANSVLRSKEAR